MVWSGRQTKTQIPKQDRQSAPCSEAWGGWGVVGKQIKNVHREETENITDRRRSQGRLPGGGVIQTQMGSQAGRRERRVFQRVGMVWVDGSSPTNPHLQQ